MTKKDAIVRKKYFLYVILSFFLHDVNGLKWKVIFGFFSHSHESLCLIIWFSNCVCLLKKKERNETFYDINNDQFIFNFCGIFSFSMS